MFIKNPLGRGSNFWICKSDVRRLGQRCEPWGMFGGFVYGDDSSIWKLVIITGNHHLKIDDIIEWYNSLTFKWYHGIIKVLSLLMRICTGRLWAVRNIPNDWRCERSDMSPKKMSSEWFRKSPKFETELAKWRFYHFIRNFRFINDHNSCCATSWNSKLIEMIGDITLH